MTLIVHTLCLSLCLYLFGPLGSFVLPGATSLQVGSAANRGSGWRSVPDGCSAQAGGDWTAHYKSGSSGESGSYTSLYSLVCSTPTTPAYFDLLLTNRSAYSPYDASLNTISGSFARINVAADTEVDQRVHVGLIFVLARHDRVRKTDDVTG